MDSVTAPPALNADRALPCEQAEVALAAGAHKSWLYLNSQASADAGGLAARAQSAGVSFAVVEVDKDALTLELADAVLAALAAAEKPCLVQCSTGTRAGAVLLLSLARQRGLNFGAAMQLALDMRLKFAEGYALGGDAAAPNALVPWVQQVLADDAVRSASAQLVVRQLFDEASSTFTYLLADADTKDAVLIDPVIEQVDRDLAAVDAAGFKLLYAINTHAHADHITGSGVIKAQRAGVLSAISAASGADADLKLAGGDELVFGAQRLTALATPGHTEGCLSYYHKDAALVFTGDTLLIRGCGRTDFQGGSSENLFASVREKLFTLPMETTVAPAHDYKGRNASTIGDEIAHNPRVGESMATPAGFAELMDGLGLAYPKKIDVAVPANMRCGV